LLRPWWKKKKQVNFIFGLIGTVEALFLLQILFLTWIIPGQIEYWQAATWKGFPRYWVIILFVGLGLLLTALDIVRRLGYSPRQFSLFSLGSLFLALTLIENAPSQITGWFILAFYSGDYIGRVMDSHLLNRKHPYPDLPATAIIFILFSNIHLQFAPSEWNPLMMIGLGGYTSV